MGRGKELAAIEDYNCPADDNQLDTSLLELCL